MEASAAFVRSFHGFSTQQRFSEEFRLLGFRDSSSISLKNSKPSESLVPRFIDNGHLKYYATPTTCGKVCKKEKSEAATIKKKLKQIKGLSKNLLELSSQLGCSDISYGFVGDDKKTISEASEILLAQLGKLRAEEKELKRKKKEEKTKLKAMLMKNRDDDDSSSSSSESSDSECEKVVDMTKFRNRESAEPQSTIEVEALTTTTNLPIEPQGILGMNEVPSLKSCWNGNSRGEGSTVAAEASTAERIEVCMGGKCKKMGSVTLLEELERRVGVEGAVVGCKCMGKCRDGPNVRVVNACDKNSLDGKERPVRPATNPLCLGVGLDNVNEIVANFCGDGSKELGLMTA